MRFEGHVRLTQAALEKVNSQLPKDMRAILRLHYQFPDGDGPHRDKVVLFHILLNRAYGLVPLELAAANRDLEDFRPLDLANKGSHWNDAGQKHHFMKRASASEYTSYEEGCTYIKTNVTSAIADMRSIPNLIKSLARFSPTIVDRGLSPAGALRNPALVTPPPAGGGPRVFRSAPGASTAHTGDHGHGFFDVVRNVARPAMKAGRMLLETYGTASLIFVKFQSFGDALHCLQDSFSPAHVTRHYATHPNKLDPKVVARANADLWKDNHELHGRLLSREDADFYDREKWLEYYEEEMSRTRPSSPHGTPVHRHPYQIEKLFYYDKSMSDDLKSIAQGTCDDHCAKDYASGNPKSVEGQAAVMASAELIRLVVNAASKPRNSPWEHDWEVFKARWLRASPNLSKELPKVQAKELPKVQAPEHHNGWRSDTI